MKDNSDEIGRWVFIGLCVGALIVLSANGMSCLPDRCGPFWGGQKGYAEILISLGTLVAVVVGGYLAWRSYRMNEKTAQSSRFQKGVELLANPSRSTSMGGMALLVEMVRTNPDDYLVAVAKVLREYASERSRAAYKVIRTITLAGDANTDWPETENDTIQALTAIGSIPFDLRWPVQLAEADGTFPLHGLCIQDARVAAVDFRRLQLVASAVSNAEFVNCDFRGSKLALIVQGALTLTNCQLDNTQLEIVDRMGTPIAQSGIAGIRYANCSVVGATLNGAAIAQ